MVWRYADERAGEDGFGPVTFTVDATDVPRGRPPFRVGAAGGGRVCLTVSGRTIRWARIDWQSGIWWLRAAAADSRGSRIVGPIDASAMHQIVGEPRTALWWRSWCRWFAQALLASPYTPLRPTRWRLLEGLPGAGFSMSPYMPDPVAVRVGSLSRALDPARHGCQRWFPAVGDERGIVAMRDSSPSDAGRVKAWRKLARDGRLPPVLVMGVTALDAHVLLDGHDRLQAALLEAVVPPVLALWQIRERALPPAQQARAQTAIAEEVHSAEPWSRLTIARMNHAAQWAHAPTCTDLVTRAFPLAGAHHSAHRHMRVRSGWDFSPRRSNPPMNRRATPRPEPRKRAGHGPGLTIGRALIPRGPPAQRGVRAQCVEEARPQ